MVEGKDIQLPYVGICNDSTPESSTTDFVNNNCHDAFRLVGTIQHTYFIVQSPITTSSTQSTSTLLSTMFSVQTAVLRAATASNKNAFFTKSNNRSFLRRSLAAKAGQAEVVLVGCGAPNRGMGWYHAVQMLEGRYVVLQKMRKGER